MKYTMILNPINMMKSRAIPPSPPLMGETGPSMPKTEWETLGGVEKVAKRVVKLPSELADITQL